MLDLIVNPIAGGKNGKRMKKNMARIERHLEKRGVDYRVHYSSCRGDAKNIAARLTEEGAPVVVAVGGDGTLHEIINGFRSFDTALGIVPCGTGNDFAYALKIPSSPEKALDLIIDGKPQYTDFMETPSVRGLNIIAMGIDVEVLKKYAALKRKTKFGYTRCLIKTLMKFDYTQFEARTENQSKKVRSFIACVANGSVFGGGIPICPPANPADGSLDFVTVRAMNKFRIIFAFLKLKRGKVLSLKQAEHQRVKNIEIIAEKPYIINVDGELYENAPFNVSVVVGKLKVFRGQL